MTWRSTEETKFRPILVYFMVTLLIVDIRKASYTFGLEMDYIKERGIRFLISFIYCIF